MDESAGPDVMKDVGLMESGSGRSDNSGTCKQHIGHRENEQPNQRAPSGSARPSNLRLNVFTADITLVPRAVRARTNRRFVTALR